MTRKLKPIPIFQNEAEERHFWETHDSADYVAWDRAERVRLAGAAVRADQDRREQRDVPHQSLI